LTGDYPQPRSNGKPRAGSLPMVALIINMTGAAFATGSIPRG